MNDPSQMLSVFLSGVLGRSGRKRARKAARFVSGNRGLIGASGMLAAAGVAWGIYDSLKAGQSGPPPPGGAGPAAASGGPVVPPPLPGSGAAPGVSHPPPASTMPADVLRIVRLAVSAARADGALVPEERAIILEHARRAGVEQEAERELDRPHPLADIVSGVDEPQARHDLYALAFTIVRADETVTGSERIYLAQLAHQLGLDAQTVARLEAGVAASIDATPDEPGA